MNIQFLDCTLRDGAHVVSGRFENRRIMNIASKLTDAQVDIIELGFLKECIYDEDKTYFPYIENAYEVIKKLPTNNGAQYALMARADEYDINNLRESNGLVNIIRVAFYYDYLERAISFAKEAAAKGYKCSLNLINTPGCTENELRHFVEMANSLIPYAVSIVDTFGVLETYDLAKIIDLYDKGLNNKIRIGLHVHENMSSSVALAQYFLENISPERDIIIDGSLMGIGRAPGNLCSEIICEYLNNRYYKKLDTRIILSAIEENILELKKKYRWGYSPEYFISAKYRVHRSYAEKLYDNNYSLVEIDLLLSHIDMEHSKKFDNNYLDILEDKFIRRQRYESNH